MKRNVLIFGLVLGTILCINMIYIVNLCYTDYDFKSNDFVGYASHVLILSILFFGIRNYRNKQLDGLITFGHAFKVGAFMLILAATMYVVVWLFYYYLFVPDFIDKYIPHVLKEVKPEELAIKTKEMAEFKEMYKNPLFIIVMTYAEIVPVGLVVVLISSLILKKK